jgi:glycerol-3-phosphate acyltransferase PlsX
MIKIAVDAMGGDFGLDTTVSASMLAIKEYKDIEIVLFGDKLEIEKRLTDSTRITIVDAPKAVSMGEHEPVRYIRNNKDCSLAQALQAGHDGAVDAVVSNGPTQVVIVGAHMVVRKLKQVSRVALCPIIPSLDGKGRILLDVGANVELRPEHILELAICAKHVSKEVLKVDNPKIGLLNIGTEEGKGRPVDVETYDVLKASKEINFYGNVESSQILTTDCNVLITDGFTGNMVMKTMEGTGKVIGQMLKQEIKKSFISKIGALLMRKSLKNFKKRMDSKEIGGAMILGLPIPVVKAHGNSDAYAFKNAIGQARIMVENKVVEKIVQDLNKEEN